MKLKKLNVTICGCELYVEENAPIEKIRQELKRHERAKLPEGFESLFGTLKPKK